MANTVTLDATLTYTPPGAAVDSAVITLTIAATYTPLVVGKLDVPAATAINTAFTVPFGTVGTGTGATTKGAYIVNRVNDQDIGLRVNALPVSPAVLFDIPPGGMWGLAHPIDELVNPLTALQVDTTALTVTDAEVDFYIFGE